MWDPPHLIKNVRNNLKKHGFVQDGKDILWSYVDNFYTADSSKPIRIAQRLTKRHIELPPFTAMRVKYATQVLSHTVAAGTSLMAEKHHTRPPSLRTWTSCSTPSQHTATFIENMDQLFNNSISMTFAKCLMRAQLFNLI